MDILNGRMVSGDGDYATEHDDGQPGASNS